ncbi:unnamed protein product [Acanthoscelides obtectus]|uniref:Uncharacterized protein n=1 Tax=Acanthoscelides obtectus TaxID=200917 RepID=A0A9P0K5E3_ACAOB|nr:unnamed protein product [Acanthoscelides obtectus]CAK1643701.1 hypothetical protein AOBTE_LOCUS13644 [Acanthoscelides obtectus]
MDYVYMVFFVSIVGVCATPIFSSDKMQIGIPMEESFPEFSETDESDELDQPDQPYKLDCGEMPEYVLEEILGPAYNARYMSLKPPPKEESQKGGKRNIVYEAVDFFVDHDLDQEVGNQAAWDVTNHVKVARENNFRR